MFSGHVAVEATLLGGSEVFDIARIKSNVNSGSIRRGQSGCQYGDVNAEIKADTVAVICMAAEHSVSIRLKTDLCEKV